MDNNNYLNSLKSRYDSLTNMFIKENVLYYDKYILPLNINISMLNPDLFLLTPEEIINVLYVLQLLYQPTINEMEKNSLIQFTKKYTELNSQNNKDFNNFGYSIPIFFAYDENFTNSPAATIIREEHTRLCEYMDSLNTGGKDKNLVRVRKNPNVTNSYEYNEYIEFSENIDRMQNAGFVTLFVIFFGIVLSILILAYA